MLEATALTQGAGARPNGTPDRDDLTVIRSSAFERLSATACVLDGHGHIVDTNEAWRLFARLNNGSTRCTGRTVSYLEVCDRAGASGDTVAAEVAVGLREILAGEREQYSIEYPCPAPWEDRWFRVEASAAPVVEGSGIVIFHVDVTAHKRREDHLIAESERDALTGFSNRRGAMRAIEERLEQGRRGGPPVWVFFLDLEGFKTVNDRYGHQVGDEILAKVAMRATQAVRDDDDVCRLGGDEFVLVCTPHRACEATSLAARLRWALSQPFQIGPHAIEVSASIGLAVGGAGATVEGLLAESDAKMYLDKEQRRALLPCGTNPPRMGPIGDPVAPVPPTGNPGHAPFVRDAVAQPRANALMLNSISEAVVAWDVDGVVTFLNTAAESLWQLSQERALGALITDVTRPILSPEQVEEAGSALDALRRWEGEIVIVRPDGSQVPVWSANAPMLEGGALIGYMGITVEISECRAAQVLLAHQASHDPLTGLATRQALRDQLHTQLSDHLSAADQAEKLVVLVDVGSLDTIVDSMGQAAGDEYLLRCAGHLTTTVHAGDDLARFSDHVFGVLCPHAREAPAARAYAERLRSGMTDSPGMSVHDSWRRISAGVAIEDPRVADTADGLIHCADIALARARTTASTVVFDQTLADEQAGRLVLEALVRETIATGTLRLAYQPIVSLSNEQTVGAEALLRLTHRNGVAAPPGDVIAAAERIGLIGELSDLILRQACADAVQWRAIVPGQPIHVAVNVSARQLDDPALPAKVASAVIESGIDPSALWLEITESTLMSDPARSAQLLSDIRATGVRLAVDDFGTGYSSLAYLKAFPLDVLKIDRSFVGGLPRATKDTAIVQMIIAMAKVLGLAVVAEGVEEASQASLLAETGADFAQGFLWSPAVSNAAFEARLLVEEEEAAD